MKEKHFDILRRHMIEVIGITAELTADELGKDTVDARVLDTMGRIPRHLFVPPELAPHAYENTPLPIGFGKTISQPFIVAVMTELLDPQPDSAVLEVGTGLGYQTAILSELAGRIWSVEIVEELATEAERRLRRQGCRNVSIRIGDGSKGWPEHGPYDRILVSAAADLVPPSLVEQLKPGGRMVLPMGQPDRQKLAVVEKDAHSLLHIHDLMPVRFTLLETVM